MSFLNETLSPIQGRTNLRIDRTNEKLSIGNHDVRYRPYPIQRPNEAKNASHFYNASLAKLISLSESFRSLFSCKNSNETKNQSVNNIANFERSRSTKKVQFNIKPNFLESENYEYSDESYLFYCSSGVSASSNCFNITSSSILKKDTKNNDLLNVLSRWTCSNCLTKHNIDRELCSVCGMVTNKLTSVSNLNAKTKPGALKLSNSNKQLNLFKVWQCDYCSYANQISDVLCSNCRALKQSKTNKSNMVGYDNIKKRNKVEIIENKENRF
ncbi:unnamed protein product [Brachionus calyciflorus]|uniref:RanBP2-type domain-containing protein n=1 Tax=Brachionus calyciflorus TaxID=104777 RepID=A0A814QTT6_9BILA|nr:unnamed protein product [Brachionus calyciflorus]